MELKHYFLFVRRWLWMIVLFSAIGGTLGYFYSSSQTPMYSASTLVMVNQDQGVYSRPSPTLEDLRARERLSMTIMELMSVRPVLAQAISTSGIDIDVGTLNRRITTENIDQTELFRLSVRHSNPDTAVILADAIVQAFKNQERSLLDNPFAQASALIVIETARAGVNPISPNISRDISLGVVLGLMLAIVIGYLLDYFNARIKDEDDMDRLSGMRPLSTVGTLRGSSPPAMLVTLNDAYSANAEAYRMFRTHLDTFPLAGGVRTVVVTSPGTREGRTVTAANLAVALAQTGRKVVLVDTDLRQPSLHEFFGLSNDIGLTNLLTHQSAEPLNYLRPTGVDNLRVLCGGPISLTPAQLLGSETFERMVEALRAEADVVVFDSPALLSVVDTSLILRVADVSLVVARSNSTTGSQLREAYTHLQQAGVSVLGILLNGVANIKRRNSKYYSNLYRRQSQKGQVALPPHGDPADGRTASVRVAGDMGD
ncbi:MAG: polysaccharide biosynthesis tyrosine autokinase [Oscillochloris sp.]|nr:polysaccharide biosynthesis tyrosine autokinase [Oscillochloris sp.]